MLPAEGVTVSGLVPPGHKVAVRAIVAGAPVRRYNQVIGVATQAIAPGQHVHGHNLAFGEFERDHAVGVDAPPTELIAPPATFQGIVRPDGGSSGATASASCSKASSTTAKRCCACG